MTTAKRAITRLEVIEDYLNKIEAQIHTIYYVYQKTGEKRPAYDYENHCDKVDENGNLIMEDVWDEVRIPDDKLDEEDIIHLRTLAEIQQKLEELV